MVKGERVEICDLTRANTTRPLTICTGGVHGAADEYHLRGAAEMVDAADEIGTIRGRGAPHPPKEEARPEERHRGQGRGGRGTPQPDEERR